MATRHQRSRPTGWLGWLVLAGLLWGCSARTKPPVEPQPRGQLLMQRLVVAGVTRRYALYLPAAMNATPLPLVLELHGGGVTIEDMTGASGHKTPYKLWMPLADAERFIVVYPEGLNGAYGKPTWNDCRADSTVSSHADDVAFLTALIDSLASQYPIDRERVYISGMSNGGLMALRLAVEAPEKVAAVATVGASMPAQSACSAPHVPVAVLFMNGTADPFLPYTGGTLSRPPKPSHGTVMPVEEAVRLWATLDQTDPQPAVTTYPDRDPNDGGRVVRYRYAHGVQGTEVILYKIYGGGHAAPSMAEQYSRLFEHYFGKQNHDIEMVREVWAFFQDKARR